MILTRLKMAVENAESGKGATVFGYYVDDPERFGIVEFDKNGKAGGSETYGKWYGIELTEENKKQFLIPRGFAHGFLALSDTAGHFGI